VEDLVVTEPNPMALSRPFQLETYTSTLVVKGPQVMAQPADTTVAVRQVLVTVMKVQAVGRRTSELAPC
jgi:hypothetical protein